MTLPKTTRRVCPVNFDGVNDIHFQPIEERCLRLAMLINL